MNLSHVNSELQWQVSQLCGLPRCVHPDPSRGAMVDLSRSALVIALSADHRRKVAGGKSYMLVALVTAGCLLRALGYRVTRLETQRQPVLASQNGPQRAGD